MVLSSHKTVRCVCCMIPMINNRYQGYVFMFSRVDVQQKCFIQATDFSVSIFTRYGRGVKYILRSV